MSPSSFLRNHVVWPLTLEIVFTQRPETVKILMVLFAGRPSNVMGFPLCRSDRQGLGWTRTVLKSFETNVKSAEADAKGVEPFMAVTVKCCGPKTMGRSFKLKWGAEVAVE